MLAINLLSEAVNSKRTLQAILHGSPKAKNCRSLSELRAGATNASGESLPSEKLEFHGYRLFFCVIGCLEQIHFCKSE
jgi:hypothetical protein